MITTRKLNNLSEKLKLKMINYQNNNYIIRTRQVSGTNNFNIFIKIFLLTFN